jgi:hypothetical protein
MSESDSLLVEHRGRYSVLVIDGDQFSGCNALDALKQMGVTWVTSLEDARMVLSEKRYDYVISSTSALDQRDGKLCRLVPEILSLAFRHATPLCFIGRTDADGLLDGDTCDHLTFRAASTENLADSMLLLARMNGQRGEIFRKMKCNCTYTVPGTEKGPNMWMKALEMLQAMCMKPAIEPKPVKANGNKRPTPIPRR